MSITSNKSWWYWEQLEENSKKIYFFIFSFFFWLVRICQLLGDKCITRWLWTICQLVNDQELRLKLVLFLEEELKVQKQKLLIQKKSDKERVRLPRESGLRCYTENQKDPSSNPTRCQAWGPNLSRRLLVSFGSNQESNVVGLVKMPTW